jgi:hypothetical protein
MYAKSLSKEIASSLTGLKHPSGADFFDTLIHLH